MKKNSNNQAIRQSSNSIPTALKANIITLGCSKNTVDSENIAGHLTQVGIQVHFDRTQNDCEVAIINTCGFIGDAKEESIDCILQQARQKANYNRRHHSDGRHRLLIASGCLIERYRDELTKEIPEVDAWFGVHEWGQLIDTVLQFKSQATRHNAQPFTAQRILSTPRHYAYIKIAEGCNRSCSYCAIPLIRGKHVSRPVEDILHEAQTLVNNGIKELILIAQDTTYYGLDLYGRRRLGELLELLATQSGAEWIRLHYTYPTSFPLDAIEAMNRHSNICNYIDIPLQHINSRILSSMQRGIDREGTLQLLQHFRTALPDVSIRTTLIVGYPGETEAEFEELKQFVSQARFDRMGCFPYSPEENTPAETLGDPVPEEEKQRRADELMAIQQQISLEKNEARVGQIYRVLIDRREGDYYIARTEYDSPDIDDEVLIPATHRLATGTFHRVRITQALEHDLMAELV